MPTGQIRVLVVEDDEVSAQAVRIMLERLGCVVDAVETGVAALESFGRQEYDLILMDWQMPLMDGIEATARIRALPRGRAIPIVGTTANMSWLQCLAAGMNDLMPKPFLIKNLKIQLARWTTWNESDPVE